MTGMTFNASQGEAIGLTHVSGDNYQIYAEGEGYALIIRVTREQVRQIMSMFGDVLRWSEDT